MNQAAVLRPSHAGTNVPLDWRGLALVIAGHAVVLGAVLWMRPSPDPVAPSPPIFASVLLSERVEPAPVSPEPEPEPSPADPTPAAPPPSVPREPDPTPVLAVPESTPVPVQPAVAPAPVESAPESATPPSDAPAVAPPGPPARTTLDSLPGSPDELRRYIAAIMRQLNRHKTYARELKKAKIEGTVVIQFTIDRDGRLLASDVKQSSGHPELDRAAMEMLARANPLPAIPDFMDRDELALAIPVEYSLITDR